MSPTQTRFAALGLLLLLYACGDPEPAPDALRGDAPEVVSPAPRLRRLTAVQYENVIGDLFGDGVKLVTKLEPDDSSDGLLSSSASTQTLSSYGVEQYETAAYNLASQVMDDDATRAAIVPCTPADTTDENCALAALEPLGHRAWRRPLTTTELDALVALSSSAAVELGDFYDGLEYGVAAILQSPNFLYRIELGEEDPEVAGSFRFTDLEMASRLSFFLWNTTPDDDLLAAAEAGDLSDPDKLAAEVDRMLEDPRTEAGVDNFVTEWLTLYDLEDLSKDTTIFTSMDDDLGLAAQEETLLGVNALVFDDHGDLRDLFTTQRSFVNRQLAAIYNVRAPSLDDFGEVRLTRDGGRRGFLGQLSFLALQAHATSSSPTLRGKFLREVLLCQPLPAPPADVNTSLPDADKDAPTMRDRLESHMADPTCASCHQFMDPVGLGFENFDGLGQWRDKENDVSIDATGDLDGVAFEDAWQLGATVRQHEDLSPCIVQTLYRYAAGRDVADGEADLLDWHAAGFEEGGHDLLSLMRDIALGPGFRSVGEVE